MPRKFPVIATCVCLMGFIVLCGLGAWQMQRLEWKNSLQADLDRAYTQERPLDVLHEEDIAKATIKRGKVVGHLDLTRAIILHGGIIDGRAADSVVAPLVIQRQDRQQIVPVEIGCSAQVGQEDLQGIKPVGAKSYTGLLRPPRRTLWAPENNIQNQEWWSIDVAQLAKYWEVSDVSPAMLVLEDVPTDQLPQNKNLFPCPVEKHLRNDHQSYAFFWFTMAGVLVLMWGLRFLRPYLQSA